MGAVAAIGERARVEGFALAGVLVFSAEDAAGARAAWAALPAGTAVAILTPRAAAALGVAGPQAQGARPAGSAPLTVVMRE